ncbi:MAG: apolipoprotein N-acyltransferase [Hydrotalea flava]|nr:apolipoprotein N-acyltransferase [Hydrotalea flava]
MKKSQLFFLSIASGLLLVASWPVSPFTFCIFFAFVPLLWIAASTTKIRSFIGYAFLSLLIWNVGTTWWIWNSTDVGSIAAIIANTILMCIPLWGYFKLRKKITPFYSGVALIVYWMLFEWIHLNWQLSWPWLTLGNVFATHPNWVQWYSVTGVSGGTLWILLVNILLFQLLQIHQTSQRISKPLAGIFLVTLLLPLMIGYLSIPTIKAANMSTNVVIVQPNIDPYQKFESFSTQTQIERLIHLSDSAINPQTVLVIWPETALPEPVIQQELNNSAIYQPVFQFVQQHPNLTLLTGLESYVLYGNEKVTPTAHAMPNGQYYDAYNSAVAINVGHPNQFYNKSKLVPGVESLPTFLNFMGPVFEKFGGTTGGYGRDTAAVVFSETNNPYKMAPIICYESIYGAYVAEYVKKGANLLTIITNDGWWGNTPGHLQHLAYARLRAIETRKFVARSANTGISAVIDPSGKILTRTDYNKAAVIKFNIPIPAASGSTLYVKWGDWLYKLAAFAALLVILYQLFKWWQLKIKR